MLLDREYKIPSKINRKINLKVVPGHFATTHSHINFYMDMTTLKVRYSEAMEVARTMNTSTAVRWTPSSVWTAVRSSAPVSQKNLLKMVLCH